MNSAHSFYSKIAYNDIDCIPMGDGCFNPQVGFIPKEENTILKGIDVPEVTTMQNSFDVDMITCDGSNAFDLFCGRAKKAEPTAPKGGLEIWFDISTSMRHIFPEQENCIQLQFAKKLKGMCDRQPEFRAFNTSVSGPTNIESLCRYSGLNDQQQLISSIKNSNAIKLIIVTDTDEYSGQLRKLIEKHHIPIRGMDLPVLGNQLLDFAHELTMYCK